MWHQKATSEAYGQALAGAAKEVSPGSDEAASVRVMKREFDIQTKLPSALVEEKARVSAEAYDTWKVARAESNFAMMLPFYRRLIEIARETANCRGYTDDPYDALIDLYEEGATHKKAAEVFDRAKGPISQMIAEISANGRPVDDSPLARDWDRPKLLSFMRETVQAIGFDMNRGRLDIAPNAFCTNFAVGDVRMTTRANNHIRGIVSSSLHEMGHGLYEQNQPAEWDLLPICGGAGMSVHESQSRMWENIVGRTLEFWKFFYPKLQAEFPELNTVFVGDFYCMLNRVEPGYFRIGSDELSYNLHIIVRFELESDLISQRLDPKDLPEAWCAKMEQYLGVTPPDDAHGVLQDVHWSRGSFGYFPTYAFGNFIGWQMWERLSEELEYPESLFMSGNFAPILHWFAEKVYRQGKRYPALELIDRVCGPMTPDAYLRGMATKFSAIYKVNLSAN